ncbi:MAG: transglycosylase SLT domain-containing protein [Chloroflexota bacterium]|nr:transglycosylase SLT domain-containing protein [Chloroflexota bacterium]
MIVVYAAALELLRHGRPLAIAVGIALTLLAQCSVLGGLVGTPRDRGTTGPVVVSLPASPARAALAPSHEATPDQEAAGGESRTAVPVAARATAIDETPASAPIVLTTHEAPPRDDPALVVATIRAAALEFGIDPDRLVAIARCESNLDPLAVGAAGELGIMQFKPATFRANAAPLGYRIDQIFDVRAQARTAAQMLSRGQAWQWSCAG